MGQERYGVAGSVTVFPPDAPLTVDGAGGDTGWTLNVHEAFMIRPGVYDYAIRLRGIG